MTYDEAVDTTVTKAEAIRELRRHCADVQEFFAEVGERDEYQGSEVLNWLGY